ncbi:MAG: hypothetical protein IJI14_13875 [Anaerolineaceae bacterium]|nr:hypothetical protein [Anaerolineaceae bacterium]
MKIRRIILVFLTAALFLVYRSCYAEYNKDFWRELATYLFTIKTDTPEEEIVKNIEQYKEKGPLLNGFDVEPFVIITWTLFDQYGVQDLIFYYAEEDGDFIIAEMPGETAYLYTEKNPAYIADLSAPQWGMEIDDFRYLYETRGKSPEEKYTEYLRVYEEFGQPSFEETGYRIGIENDFENMICDMCGENCEQYKYNIINSVAHMIWYRTDISAFYKILENCKNYNAN